MGLVSTKLTSLGLHRPFVQLPEFLILMIFSGSFYTSWFTVITARSTIHINTRLNPHFVYLYVHACIILCTYSHSHNCTHTHMQTFRQIHVESTLCIPVCTCMHNIMYVLPFTQLHTHTHADLSTNSR